MAIGDPDSFRMAAEEHCARKGRVERALRVVERIIDRSGLDAPPWSDPDFQQAVMQSLEKIQGLRRDAEKLAILKEVFSGK